MTTTRLSTGLFSSAMLRLVLGVPIIALIVLLPAGQWDYWQGWMYLSTLFTLLITTVLYLYKYDPALLERRMRMREKEAAQRGVIALSSVYFLVIFCLPGLDVRYGWSNVPPSISIFANGFVFAGYMIFVWVLTVNSFLSRVVEVDAGQKVISSGPYAIVRHPMYTGFSLMSIATPLALGSYWALLPALLIIPLLAARIRNEEQVLQRELPGYTEYTHKVEYRLIPGVW